MPLLAADVVAERAADRRTIHLGICAFTRWSRVLEGNQFTPPMYSLLVLNPADSSPNTHDVAPYSSSFFSIG